MARLNIDDEWYADPTCRRKALIDAVSKKPRNPAREADGTAADAWRLAQRYWKDGKKLIPKDVWRRADLDVLFEADLAEERPDGIYVRGTAEKADWLQRKVDAGRKGGLAGKSPTPQGPGPESEAVLQHEGSIAEAVLKQCLSKPEALPKHEGSSAEALLKQTQASGKPLVPVPVPAPVLDQNSPLSPPVGGALVDDGFAGPEWGPVEVTEADKAEQDLERVAPELAAKTTRRRPPGPTKREAKAMAVQTIVTAVQHALAKPRPPDEAKAIIGDFGWEVLLKPVDYDWRRFSERAISVMQKRGPLGLEKWIATPIKNLLPKGQQERLT